MGPRQTAVNTLSYATRSRGEKAGQESTKVIGTDVCECPRCTESGPGPRVDQRSPTPVGGGWTAATTAFVHAKPTPSRFPADRPGHQDLVGHRVTPLFSFRLRGVQHFTYRLEAES